MSTTRVDVLFNVRGNAGQFNATVMGIRQQMAAFQQQASVLGADTLPALNKEVAAYRTQAAAALNATGQWQVMTTKAINPMTQMTTAIQKQEVTWGNLGKVMRNSGRIAQDQMRLHGSMFMGWQRNAAGDIYGELAIPRHIPEGMSKTAMQARVLSEAFGSANKNLIKWGKNTQWAGRQLTVGLTLPIFLAVKGMTDMAREIDKQVTGIVKVYDFGADASEAAMERIRQASIDTATNIATTFGIAVSESLDVTRQFAQMGYQGEQLQRMTEQTMRFATLGEIDHATATNLVANTMASFGMTVEEVTATLDRFNQVENNTRLGMDEISRVLPKFSAVLENLEMSPEYGAALLAGMKEFGIEADRAATTLNFGLNRLFGRKTQLAMDAWKDQLDIDLNKLLNADDAQGSLERLAKTITGLSDKGQKLELLGLLVEPRRAGDFLQLLKAIEEGEGTVNDYRKALQALELDAPDAARLAQQELDRLLESNSKRIDIAREKMKAIFAEIGREILPMVTSLVEGLGRLVERMTELPSRVRKGAFIALIGAAIAGPVIMAIGLFANLLGSVAGAFKFLFSVGLKFKGVLGLTNIEQKKNELSTRNLQAALMQQAQAYDRVAVAATNASIAQRGASTVPVGANTTMAGMPGVTAVGGAAGAAGAAGRTGIFARMGGMGQGIAGLGRVVGMAGMLATVLGLVGQIFGGSNKVVQSISDWALKLGPVMSILAFLPAAISGVAVPVLAVAAGLRWWAVHSDTAARNIELVGNSTQELVESAGYEWQELGKITDRVTDSITQAKAATEEFKKENLEVVEAFAALSEEQRESAVYKMQWEMKQRGMKPEEIIDVTRQLFLAADLRLPVSLEMKDPEQQAADMVNRMRQLTQGRASLLDAARGADFGTEAEAEMNQQVDVLVDAINTGDYRLLHQYQQMLATAASNREDMIRTMTTDDSVLQYSLEKSGRTMEEFIEDINNGIIPAENMSKANYDMVVAMAKAADGESYFIEKLAQGLGVSEDAAAGMNDLTAVLTATEGASVASAMALDILAQAQKMAAENGGELTDAMWDQIMADAAAKFGLEDVAESADRLREKSEGAAEGINKVTQAQRQMRDAALSAVRSNVAEELSSITDAMANEHDRQTQLAEEAYDDQIEASNDMYDKRIEQSNRFYDRELQRLERTTNKQVEAAEETRDAEVEAIQDRIDWAEELDKRRQEMFDRERARMAYMTNQSNTQLRMLTAMRTGDRDEAAILRNEMRSNEYDYYAEDAQSADEQFARQRNARAQNRMDAIKDEADERIKNIKKVADARKRDLEREKRQRERNLQNQRDAAAEALEIAKEQYTAQREEHKRMLEQQLEDLKAQTPKSEAAMERRATKINKIANEYGLDMVEVTKDYGDDVGRAYQNGVRTARQELAEDRGWERLGRSITDKITSGGLGLTRRQLFKFLRTGKLSKEAKDGMKDAVRGAGAGSSWGGDRGTAHHSGGMAGSGQPHKGPIRPDEVPAVLQRGEYVIDRRTVQRLGAGTFRDMQSRKQSIPKFHDGGMVGGLDELISAPVMGITQMFGKAIPEMMVNAAAEFGKTNVTNLLAEMGYTTPAGTAGGIDAFMAAIRHFESGGNYGITNPWGYHGAYQFGPALWNEWDRRTLGYDVDLYSANKREQDAVARAAMQHYYDQYQDWGAVAAAWIGGPGGAAAYLAGGEGASDQLGTSVREYVNKIMDKMAEFAPALMPGGTFGQGGDLGPVGWRTLDRVMKRSGITHTRTSDVRYGTDGSWHNLINGARAADFSTSHTNSGYGDPGLARIYDFWLQYGGQLKELILAGTPDGKNVKNGQLVPGYSWGNPGEAGNHWNHVHVAYHQGGLVGDMAVPKLFKGGKVTYDNTLANLHRGETVLTARLSDKLESGLNKLDSGAGNTYNVDIILQGYGQVDTKALARDVRMELQRIDSRTTRGRKLP